MSPLALAVGLLTVGVLVIAAIVRAAGRGR